MQRQGQDDGEKVRALPWKKSCKW